MECTEVGINVHLCPLLVMSTRQSKRRRHGSSAEVVGFGLSIIVMTSLSGPYRPPVSTNKVISPFGIYFGLSAWFGTPYVGRPQGFVSGAVERRSQGVSQGVFPTSAGCSSVRTSVIACWYAQLYCAGTGTEIVTTILVAEQCVDCGIAMSLVEKDHPANFRFRHGIDCCTRTGACFR